MSHHISSYQGNKALLYIRSGLVVGLTILMTLLICPVLLLATLLPFSVRYKIAALWVNCTLWLVKNICGLHYEVLGKENIPADRAAIILCKHQSAWETIALQQVFPPQVFLLKQSLLWMPFWGWAMATLKPIAINRDSQKTALRKLVRQGTERLKEGLCVVIFPEGTRSAPGETHKFNAGGCLLAQRSGFPVIPVAHNAGEFWPRYSFLKYPGTIKVKIGPMIESHNRKASDLNAEVESWISKSMQELN
jgi:1-acyl-sn-glycerol-3-phosphate acyltransferase